MIPIHDALGAYAVPAAKPGLVGPSCRWPRPAETDVCPSCGGDGAIVTDQRDPKSDRWLIVECDCLEERRRRKLWDAAGVGGHFRSCTFASYPGRPAASAKVQAWLNEPARPSLYLWGGFGGGKTSLAVAALRTVILERGVRGVFTTTPDLLAEIRTSFDRAEVADRTDLMRTVPFLVLDDIGAERVTDWVAERLFLIVNYRHDHVLPTVFTSNLTLQTLAKHIGDRTLNRVSEMSAVVHVDGPNLRIPKNRKEIDQ